MIISTQRLYHATVHSTHHLHHLKNTINFKSFNVRIRSIYKKWWVGELCKTRCGQGCLVGVNPGSIWYSRFKFLLMTSVANWKDFGLTILSARVQVPSKLDIWFCHRFLMQKILFQLDSLFCIDCTSIRVLRSIVD